MSFGFGVGDFMGVGTLVWNIYNAYASAPEQFRNFSQEILSLHVVVKTIEDQLRNQGPGNNLSAKHSNDLKTFHDGLQTIMKELDTLLKKYQSLTEDHSISFDRLRWGQEDLVGFRERIITHVGLLTAFNTSLTCGHVVNQSAQLSEQNASFAQHTAQLAAIQEQLGQIFAGAAWKELYTEFHCNGVTPEMIKAKKNDIIKLFRAATAMSSNDDTLQDTQGKLPGSADAGAVKKAWAPLSDILSFSATRAQYYVAALSPSSRPRGFTTLHSAVEWGHLRAVERLLGKGASIDARDGESQTALHLVAQNGRSEVANLLLENGASIDATDDNGRTALHLAAQYASTEAVKVLLEQGASSDVTDVTGWTALHLAALNGQTEVLNALLANGARIDATDGKGRTALHLAAQFGDTKIVNALLGNGASIDAIDGMGWTALHLAASRYWGLQLEAVELLLLKGANIELTTKGGKTALEIAQDASNSPVVKLLTKRSRTVGLEVIAPIICRRSINVND